MAGWLPPGKQTFVDEDGAPLVGGFVHHYRPGGSTRKDTWQDYDQDTLNTNPIVLDDRGQAIIFGTGNYRQRLTDADGVEIWDRNTSIGAGSETLSAGAIYGLTLGNNASAPNTVIDIAAGQARDSTNTIDIVLSAGFTKSIAAVWSVGSAGGMRDSATALAAAQSYHVFVILDIDTGAVDVLCSQSPTNPTLPTGYTYFRRIGSLPVLGSANIPPSGTNIALFEQWGDFFQLVSPNNEWTAQTGNTAAQLKLMYVPLGIKVNAWLYGQNNITPATAGVFLRVTDPDLGVPPAFGAGNQYGQIRLGSAETYLTDTFTCPTNTSGQVYVQVNNALCIWALKTLGWWDYRGAFG